MAVLKRLLKKAGGSSAHGPFCLTASDRGPVDSRLEDFEQAMLTGQIVRRQKDRLGRRKYTVEGAALDKKPLRAVCRFSDTGDSLVVITIYEAT